VTVHNTTHRIDIHIYMNVFIYVSQLFILKYQDRNLLLIITHIPYITFPTFESETSLFSNF